MVPERNRPRPGGPARERATDGRPQRGEESLGGPTVPAGRRSGGASAVRERFGDVADDARLLASDTGRLARESLGPLEEIVRKHPFESALAAAGIGFVLGALLKSR